MKKNNESTFAWANLLQERIPSVAVDVKASQVRQFYKHLGMKLHAVEACKDLQTAGEDIVHVAMGFEPVVDLRDDGAGELPYYRYYPKHYERICIERNGKDVSDLREAIGKEIVDISTGQYKETEVFFLKLKPVIPQAEPEQQSPLMTYREQKYFLDFIHNINNQTSNSVIDQIVQNLVEFGTKVRNRVYRDVSYQPPEQLMTLEEQHEFVELMKARKQLTQDQYDRCAEMVFEMVERRLRSQQAEAPADGSTD